VKDREACILLDPADGCTELRLGDTDALSSTAEVKLISYCHKQFEFL
jgi:hypothetical protein